MNKKNLKCPVCGGPLTQNPKNGARYNCNNPNCVLIEIWFKRIIYDSTVKKTEQTITA